MDALYLTLLFVLGLIIGSFLNVVIIRTRDERSIGGRSACMACKRILKAFEMVPVFSFVALRGQCRTCNVSLSWQYPLVELLTGFVFVGVAQVLGFGLAAIANPLWWFAYMIQVALWCLFVIIAFHDLETTIIPDKFVYSAALLALVSHMVTPYGFASLTPEAAIAGPLVAAPLLFLWLISHGRWIGLADSKLALSFGWLLGLAAGFSALVLAFWIGAIVSVILLGLQRYVAHSRTLLPFLHKKLSLKSEVPFGPFLILGCAVAYFWGFNLFTMLLW